MRAPLNLASLVLITATFLTLTTLQTIAAELGTSRSSAGRGPAIASDAYQSVLIIPPQGSSTTGVLTFQWAPMDGAAQYKSQFADSALFNGASTVMTCGAMSSPQQ